MDIYDVVRLVLVLSAKTMLIQGEDFAGRASLLTSFFPERTDCV